MGVDYSSVGGIGVEVTDKMIQKFINAGLFTDEEFSVDPHGCLEEVELEYSVGGSAYSGDETFYLLVPGVTLKDINDNVIQFISRLSDLEIKINVNSLKVISDYYVY